MKNDILRLIHLEKMSTSAGFVLHYPNFEILKGSLFKVLMFQEDPLKCLNMSLKK